MTTRLPLTTPTLPDTLEARWDRCVPSPASLLRFPPCSAHNDMPRRRGSDRGCQHRHAFAAQPPPSRANDTDVTLTLDSPALLPHDESSSATGYHGCDARCSASHRSLIQPRLADFPLRVSCVLEMMRPAISRMTMVSVNSIESRREVRVVAFDRYLWRHKSSWCQTPSMPTHWPP